jgi:predicted metallopeptidase
MGGDAMNLLFWRNKELKEAPRNAPINNKTMRNFVIKAVGLIAKQGMHREEFSYPEYDLEEIKIASLSDSYIKQALMKYSYLIYKAGYSIKSENEAAAEYIKKRFRIMSFATQTPMDITFQEIADDLVKYSNAFLVKSRVDSIMPGIKATGVYANKPVGGYFRIDPSTIRIKRDKNGKVLKYQQIVDGEEKNFPAVDVVHFYLDKEPNNAFGTPRIIAAMEDVKLLRKIEGNIISLIYRFAIPIYQWMIGLPEQGFQATDKEIQDARNEVEKVAMDGMIITNERTQIKAIGAEGHALDASGYLSYFEKRVFTALSVSESQMGRGGSKQDADSMEAQAHDTVKYIQRTLSIFIENYMINELLLEGGFNPILNEDDIVKYEFEETSLDTKVKVENHEILKYQSNVSTLEETRRKLGKKEKVEEKRLYANVIDNKNAIAQIREKTKGALELQKSRGPSGNGDNGDGSGIAGNGQPTSSAPNGDVENRNRPENQHGKTSVKIKESAEDAPVMLDNSRKDKASNKKTYSTIYKKYKELRNDIVRNGEDIDMVMPVSRDSLVREVSNYITLASQDGIAKALKDAGVRDGQQSIRRVDLSSLEEDAKKTITKLLKDIKGRIKKSDDPDAVFESLEYRLRYLLEYIVPKAYWYSYVKACAQIGIDKVYVDFKGSHDENDHPSVINTKRFHWEDIPAYHPFCDCEVTLKAGDNK